MNSRGIYFIRVRVEDWLRASPERFITTFINDPRNNVSSDDFVVKIGMSENALKIRLGQHRNGAFRGVPEAVVVETFLVPPRLTCVFENFINWLTGRLQAHMQRIDQKKDFYILDQDYGEAYKSFLHFIRVDIDPLLKAGDTLNLMYENADPVLFENELIITPAAHRRRITRGSKRFRDGEPVPPLQFD